jgi:two-component system chemotaxis response regulator CheB
MSGRVESEMANRDIVAIGTSAGGVAALCYLAERLPPGLPASLLITIHLSKQYRSSLDELLTRSGPLPAAFATEGEKLRKGRIFVAPPDRHLIVEEDRIILGAGPRENNARPSIDVMLRSVALCCGPRTVGVVLTGTLGDGASGLWAVGECGGIGVVQDPSDAAFAEMPENALRLADPDHVARLRDLPALIENLVHQPAGEPVPAPDAIRYEVMLAKNGRGNMEKMDQIGKRSFFACPDCHGVMWEIREGDLVRYRCHVGHTYSANLMDLALDESLRDALASALRTLEERVALARKLGEQAVERNHRLIAVMWAERVRDYQQEAGVIRDAVRRMDAIAATAAAE